uniref:Uncharacterized protein n=1 Tax=Anguilla anguilla TaxID=7936 RepID=A0A0E9Y0D1_ANGAN
MVKNSDQNRFAWKGMCFSTRPNPSHYFSGFRLWHCPPRARSLLLRIHQRTPSQNHLISKSRVILLSPGLLH